MGKSVAITHAGVISSLARGAGAGLTVSLAGTPFASRGFRFAFRGQDVATATVDLATAALVSTANQFPLPVGQLKIPLVAMTSAAFSIRRADSPTFEIAPSSGQNEVYGV